MKIFTNKNVIQKIIIAILIVLSFNFVAPTFSQASFGGVLFGALWDLIAGIFDTLASGLQYFMYDGDFGYSVANEGWFGGFLGQASDFDELLKNNPSLKYDSSEGNAQITINADDFDRGWAANALSSVLGTTVNGDNFGIPIIKYSPEKIFSGTVPSLDVNFINPKYQKDKNGQYPNIDDVGDTTADTQEQLEKMVDKSITAALHNTIASWYVALRNLAIVGLLSVLLYVGIRIIISSTASDKAKYKQMLMDWIISLCILFFLHYIMVFILTITSQITAGIGNNNAIAVTVTNTGNPSDIKFNTDLMGLCRFQIQYKDAGQRTIYLIMYIALVIYTIMFTWIYVKRAITMAFLTLMAPVVALTYPIDKMNDGKAQAFNIWLKEFTFNALLQPFHLILYTVFLGSAMNIAVENPIYAILFLAFIVPAENILRKMFGFDKASTAGGISSAAGMFGGAAAFKMLNNVISKGNKAKGNGGSGNKGIREQKPIEDPNAPSGVDGFTNPSLSDDNTEDDASEAALAQYESQWGDGGWDGHGNASTTTSSAQGVSGSTTQRELDGANNPAAINTNTDNETAEKRGARIIRGFKNKGTSLVQDKLASKHWWRKQGMRAGRIATRAVTTGAIGAIGLGMGIAGNDLEDVLTYGAAGAVLGATAGGNLALKGINSVTSGVSSQWNDIRYGSHMEALEAQQTRAAINDEEFRASVQDNYQPNGEALHGKELEQAVRRAADYYNNGITDNKQIAKTMKLEDKINKELETQNSNMEEEARRDLAKTRATTVAKLADKIDDNYLRDPDKVNNLKNSLTNGIVAKGLSKKDAETNANEMIKQLKSLKKVD